MCAGGALSPTTFPVPATPLRSFVFVFRRALPAWMALNSALRSPLGAGAAATGGASGMTGAGGGGGAAGAAGMLLIIGGAEGGGGGGAGGAGLNGSGDLEGPPGAAD